MINQKHIDKIYEHYYAAVHLLASADHTSYLEGIVLLAQYLDGKLELNSELASKVDRELAKFDQDYLNEEVRQALSLLLVNGFQDFQKYPYDYLVPDFFGILMTAIFEHALDEPLRILHVNAKTGNTLNLIANHLSKEHTLTATTFDEFAGELVAAVSSLCHNPIDVMITKPKAITGMYDAVIGGLGEARDLQAELLAIVPHMSDQGIFCYLTDYQFFSDKTFKDKFPGSIIGVVIFPEQFFQANREQCLIIGTNKQVSEATTLFHFNDSSAQALQNGLNDIMTWAKEIKKL